MFERNNQLAKNTYLATEESKVVRYTKDLCFHFPVRKFLFLTLLQRLVFFGGGLDKQIYV